MKLFSSILILYSRKLMIAEGKTGLKINPSRKPGKENPDVGKTAAVKTAAVC
jgi:hypothetical protein